MSYQIFHLLLHTSKVVKDSDQDRLRELGVHPGQAWLIDVLSRFGTMKLIDVAGILNVKLPAISRMSKSMAAQGLITRKRNEQDEREVLIELTQDGADLVPSIREAWERIETEMLSAFSERDKDEFKRLLKQLVDAIGPRG